MAVIIDRRPLGNSRPAENVRRFKERYKRLISEAVGNLLDGTAITDLTKDATIAIDSKSIEDHPTLGIDRHTKKYVFTHNTKWRVGDTIPKNPQGGAGRGAGKGDGEDDEFKFTFNADELREYIFGLLGLPNWLKKKSKDEFITELKHAGFINNGVPSNLSIIRSFKQAIGRQLTLQGAYDEEIEKVTNNVSLSEEEKKTQIEALTRLRNTVPFIDDIDLRYRHKEEINIPITKGVIFFALDISGSMDEERKHLAKVFFALMYLFIQQYYSKVEVVWIHHTDRAYVVNEKEFFNSQKSGGTEFTPVYELISKLITDKYPPHAYNTYVCHSSDIEVFENDVQSAITVLKEQILTQVNLYLLVGARLSQERYSFYKMVKDWDNRYKNFQMVDVMDQQDVIQKFIKIFSDKADQ
jgi:uncharacterized sporulation protein YeaH/YhbH (DUF444 family)